MGVEWVVNEFRSLHVAVVGEGSLRVFDFVGFCSLNRLNKIPVTHTTDEIITRQQGDAFRHIFVNKQHRAVILLYYIIILYIHGWI